MQATKYCLEENILSIEQHYGVGKECLYVPAGTVVSVLADTADTQFVEVEWNTKRVLMFNVDIQERAHPL